MMETIRQNYILLINSQEEKDVLFLDFFADFPELTLAPTEELDFSKVQSGEMPMIIVNPGTVMDGKRVTFYNGPDHTLRQIAVGRFNPDGAENQNFAKTLRFSLSPAGIVTISYGEEEVTLSDEWPDRDTMILFIMISRAYVECPEETVNNFGILHFLGVDRGE